MTDDTLSAEDAKLVTLPDNDEKTHVKRREVHIGLSASGNAEILGAWLLIAIRNRYEPAFPALDRFLTSQGRRKFLTPLYTELAKTDWGRTLAMDDLFDVKDTATDAANYAVYQGQTIRVLMADAPNLAGLCWAHHRLVHEGGWTLTGNADDTLTFTSPTGRTLTSSRQPTRRTTQAAVELAEESGMTLVGFLREPKMNIYAGAHRVTV